MAKFEAKQIDKKKSRKDKKSCKPVLDCRTAMHRMLKDIHPNLQISEKAMRAMNDMIIDVADRLMLESKPLFASGRGDTLTSIHVQASVRLLFRKNLASHAIQEGHKAVHRFYNFDKKAWFGY